MCLRIASTDAAQELKSLLESVHCFRHYHGIDCKLLFDLFNVMLDVPCSLTLDKDFAYTFGKGGGIMLELNHGTLSDLQSLCLDSSSTFRFCKGIHILKKSRFCVTRGISGVTNWDSEEERINGSSLGVQTGVSVYNYSYAEIKSDAVERG